MPPPFRPTRPRIASVVRTPLVVPLPAAATTGRPIAALVEELRQLRASVNRSVHRSGVILRELSQPPRIAEAGVVDFAGVLARYDLGSPMSASKYIAVAESFTEEEAAELGVERGAAIIRGARALPEPVAPRELLAENPTITVATGSHPLRAAPLRAVLEWANALRLSQQPRPTKQALRDADSVRDKLHRRFAAAGIEGAAMRLRRRGQGYVVRIEVTPEQAAVLARLMRATK